MVTVLFPIALCTLPSVWTLKGYAPNVPPYVAMANIFVVADGLYPSGSLQTVPFRPAIDAPDTSYVIDTIFPYFSALLAATVPCAIWVQVDELLVFIMI